MNVSSDEFDAFVRQPLYDVLDQIIGTLDLNQRNTALLKNHVEAAVFLSDDFRVDLMDEEGELDKEEDET